MSSHLSYRFQSTRRALRKTALVLSALAFGLNGCSTQPTPQQQEQEDSATATFSIKSADFFESSEQSGSRSAASLRAAQAFTFSDVRTLRITVKDKVSNSPLYVNFDLGFSAGEWSGELPFLPKNKALVFHAEALDASRTLLFKGDTEQTLSLPNQTIVIALSAANDGRAISIPRIRKISVPSAFGSDQAGNVSFSVEANTGETLTYEITPAQGGGTFYPVNGTITLAATSGTFVSQYAPPTVSANTEFEHTVKVTNPAGNSVTTTFKTKIKPPGSTDGVQNTGITVLVNPVINTVNARRITGTSDVLFQASVSDNDATADLRYAWSFASAPSTSFPLTFTSNGSTNPSTLQNYTTAAQGTITLAVTDTDNGTTTLTYPLTPNQFPDNPVVEGGLTGINSIRAGDSHTCALFNNGTLRCWGLNGNGQLGYGNTFTIGNDEQPYEAGDVPLVGVGAKLAVGGNHTCVLMDTGLVRCWGKNNFGQLGYNTTDSVGDGEAIASYGYVNLGGIATKIAAGYEHTCALMDTGHVRCWGRNNYGQLGRGNTFDVGDDEQPSSDEGSDVELGSGTVKNIVAGGHHTCALMDNGRVRCWGYNGYGQLGYGNTTNIGDTERPVLAGEVNVGGSTVLQLTAGDNHTCALLSTGNMRCWGYNGQGQLGYGNVGSVLVPTSDVAVGGQVLQISAGKLHTCALLGTGDVKCWGYGASGRLGYPGSVTQLTPPEAAVDLDGHSAFQLTAGGSHTCALLSTGGARCWGENASGQLGYGNTNDVSAPSSVDDIRVLQASTP